MKQFIVTIVGLLFLVGMGISVGQADPGVAPKFMGGTIQGIDPAGLSITLKTDQGKTEFLPVANAEAVKGLVMGDRVSVELDDKGTVIKIVKAPSDLKDSPKPKS